jgi:hypothetical protein
MEIYALLLRLQSNLPQSPAGLLEDNITFVDVLNRKISLPFSVMQHWKVAYTLH